ncbi:hypothetical protein ABIB68_007827 [Bradyrhizobium sp. F1.2.2]
MCEKCGEIDLRIVRYQRLTITAMKMVGDLPTLH